MTSTSRTSLAVAAAALTGAAAWWRRRRRFGPGSVAPSLQREEGVRRRLADLEALEAQVRLERDEAETLLDRLLQIAPVGIGFIDTDLRFGVVNDALAAINGVPAADHRGRLVGELLPDLAVQNEAILRRVLGTGDPVIDIEVRGATPAAPDTPRDWLAGYVPVFADDGTTMGVAVSVVDITEREAMARELAALREEMASDRFRRALDALVDAVILVSPVPDTEGGIGDLRIDWVNAAATDAHGRSAEELRGAAFRDLWPTRDGERSFELFCRAIREREAVVEPTFRYRYTDHDGREVEQYFDLRVAPFGDGALGSWTDVTDAVNSRRRLAERERSLAEAQRVGRIGSFRLDLDSGRAELSDQLRRMVGRDLAGLDDLLAALDPSGRDDLLGAVEAALRGGDRFALEHRILQPGSRLLEVRTIGEVERRIDGTVRAVSGVVQDVSELRRTEQRVRVLTDELAAEHSALLALQQSLLPRHLPEVPGYDLDARYLGAAARVEIGGDWYDVVPREGGEVAMVVGDAAGHGLAAVGLMAEVRHALRAYLAECDGPAEALWRTSKLVRADQGGFATVAVAQLDPGTGSLRWASAGHLPPLIGSASGRMATGPPLGAMRGARYDEHQLILPPGGSLLMFTDGLVERRGEPIDDGLARLEQVWGHVATVSMPVAALLAAMSGDGPAEDDVCVLWCRRRP